jgi:hypothetical protein
VSAVVFVTVAILAADLILGAPRTGETFAHLAASWAIPAALAALVTAVLARRSTSSWAWWRYPLTLGPTGLLLFAVLSPSSITSAAHDAGRLEAGAGRASDATAPTPMSAPVPTPPPTRRPNAATTLRRPAKLAGLELITDPATERTAERLAAQMRERVGFIEPLVAFYQDPSAENRLVQLSGASGVLVSPLAELERGFKVMNEELPITNIRDVAAGPLGGYARCGSANQHSTRGAAVPLTVCSWADHSSVVIVVFYNRPFDKSAELLLRIRSGVETA